MGNSSENPPLNPGFPIRWHHSGEDLGTATVLLEGLRVFRQIAAERHESPAGLRKIADRRLRRIVRHAVERVPLYRERFREQGIDPQAVRTLDDLPHLPILERRDLSGRAQDLIAHPRGSGGKLIRRWIRTSGSSGTPVWVILSTREFITNLGLILEGFAGCGWKPWHTVATVCVPTYRRNKNLFQKLGLMQEELIDLREGARANLQQLRRIGPELIYGYPSQLALIARELETDATPAVKPRVVVTNGESLDPQRRARISQAFQAPVRDTYGSAEFCRIGNECSEGVIHLNSTMVCVEHDPQTEDETGAADVLVTSLYQQSMPLIRYRLGDRCIRADPGCPCGSNHPGLREISGRREEFVHLPSGRKISPRAINLLEEVPSITAFQLIQTRPDQLQVRVDAASGDRGELESAVERVLREGLGGESVLIEIHRDREFLRSGHGKIPAFVSQIDLDQR